MASFTKTIQAALLALQSVAASSVVVGSAFDMSGKIGGMVQVRFGRRATTAAGAGANIRIEVSKAAAGDNSWFPLAIFTSAFAATNSQPITTTSNAAQNVLTMTTTTNMAIGDVVFIDNGTIGNSEWARIKAVSAAASVTIEDNLVNNQANTTPVYRAAEIYPPVAIPEGVYRIRAVADGSLFTQAWAVEVTLTTVDSIG